MQPIIVVQPTVEPLSLAQAYRQLRIPYDDAASPFVFDDEAEDIQETISDAREWCEMWLERSIASKTYEIALDAFPGTSHVRSGSGFGFGFGGRHHPSFTPGAIQLPMPIVTGIESIQYLDPVAQTWETLGTGQFALDSYSQQGWVVPAVGSGWPEVLQAINSVKVRYIAGYPNGTVPGPIKRAMRLLLGHFHENREASVTGVTIAELPLGVESLLEPYRVRLSMA